MIQIEDPKDCCGCGACVQVCPKRCIAFQENAEGFEYPHVDQDRCIDCGRCEQVCPLLHREESRMPLQVKAAVTPRRDVLMQSSSGGMFHALASNTIAQGGTVFGARWDAQFQLCQQGTDQLSGLTALQGSKYVQSSNHEAFRAVADLLKKGRPVLFCGTPCMVAGLRRYVGRDDPNLLCADFFCHGVPSPGVWRAWLSNVLNNQGIKKEEVANIEFRNKATGWRRYRMVITLNDGRRLSIKRSKNTFQQAFDENLTLRASCYACQMRRGRSHSDLTLADFWDIAYVKPALDHDTGYSLVLCNTEKGVKAFQHTVMQSMDIPLQAAIAHNPAFLSEQTPMHPRRAQFFEQWQTGSDTGQLLSDTLKRPFTEQLLRDVNALKYRIKLFVITNLKKLKSS